MNAYTGKVETNILFSGRGPGESSQICDIAFDEKREQILAFNDYEKLVFFSLDGRFLKEERIGKLYENITCVDDNIIFYNESNGYSCYPHTVNIYNIVNKEWKTIGQKKKVDFNVKGKGRIMVKSKNIWFTPILDYGLHVLAGDSIIVPYKLDVKRTITEDLQKMSVSDFPSFAREVQDRNILFSITSIRETEKYLIFNTNLGFMMMDKNTLELHNSWCIDDEYLGLKLLNYFPHDGDDNKIMFIVQPDEWLQRKPYELDDMPEHLKTQIENVNMNEESNPLLVFYKEK